ncbi:MAG: sodium:calcium antiporter [Candidatus Thorarchaeota archaeon]
MDLENQDTHHEYESLKSALGASKIEFAIAGILIATFFYFRFFTTVHIGIEVNILITLGIVMGTWLAFRPSEWAVEGIESLAGHRGYTAYIAGLLSSLVSNMPEAVVSGLAAYQGYAQNSQDLLDIAILSVLIAAGFNMLLLGITIVIATRGKGDMDVPEEVIRKDSVLIRWTIVALVSMFALGIVDLAATTATGDIGYFPREASFILFVSYLVYAYSLKEGEVGETSAQPPRIVPHFSKRNTAILMLLGFVGIFFAGEMLTFSVEMLLETQHDFVASIGDPVYIAAFILGAAGALPEHGIAVIGATKGKVGLAVGNLVGGVLQLTLLVGGGIGMFVPIPLDRYVLFQIVVLAGSLWFMKRNISDDKKLDMFEGLMIILLQAYVFLLLLIGSGV